MRMRRQRLYKANLSGNIRTVCYTLILSALLEMALGSVAPAEPNAHDNPLSLAARMNVYQNGHAPSLDIELKNGSDRVACVGKTAFETVGNSVVIRDSTGRSLGSSLAISPGVKEFHGVNYAVPYYFLFPGKALNFSVNLKYLSLRAGVYSYEWPIPYYACTDVANLSRNTAPPYLYLHFLHVTGKIVVSP